MDEFLIVVTVGVRVTLDARGNTVTSRHYSL